MTMHLEKAYLTTTNYKQKKKKTDTKKYYDDWHTYNKQMKKLGAKEKTYQEYIQYREGKAKVISKKPGVSTQPARYHRPSPIVPSMGDQVGNIPAKPEKQYNGERKLIGIAVLHKSNSVPVFEKQDAIDIANMRRN